MKGDVSYASGFIWALLATALWGGTFLGPAAVEPVGPIYLVFGRYMVFGLLSLVVLAVNIREISKLGLKRILAALHLGVFGYIGFYLFFALSASIGGGTLASIVTGAMPAFVTITSNAIKKEVSWMVLVIPISITSIGLLIVNLQTGSALGDYSPSDYFIATALSLGACVMWAYFVVVNGLILKKQSGPKISNSAWTALIGIGAFLASFLLLPFVDYGDGVTPTVSHATLVRYLVVIVLIATLGSWCASWTWNMASKSLSTVIMGQLIAMETIFGLAFNLMWEQRLPQPTEALGATLVFLGVILCVRIFERARLARPTSECIKQISGIMNHHSLPILSRCQHKSK